MKLKLGIFGCCGKMGESLIKLIVHHEQMSLACAIARQESIFQDKDVSALIGGQPVGVSVQTLNHGFGCAQVMIDFSQPESSLALLTQACRAGIPVVLGTTGFTQAQMLKVHAAGEIIPIVYAANFSFGINLLLAVLPSLAKHLGKQADIEIIEAHHRCKADAPSGTALALGQSIANTLDIDLNTQSVYGRQGNIGHRPSQQIGFSAIRGGDIVGEHTVLFAQEGERLELTHKVSNRTTFAQGAVYAAQWLQNKSAGLYSMQDVLSL